MIFHSNQWFHVKQTWICEKNLQLCKTWPFFIDWWHHVDVTIINIPEMFYYHVITLMSSLDTFVKCTWRHVVEDENCCRPGESPLLIRQVQWLKMVSSPSSNLKRWVLKHGHYKRTLNILMINIYVFVYWSIFIIILNKRAVR